MSKDNKKNIVTLNSLKSFTKSSSMDSIKAAVLAAILGLVFGFIVMLLANPTHALAGMNAILVGGLRRIPDVFYYATPIMMTGLAVGFAYSSRKCGARPVFAGYTSGSDYHA